MAESLTYIDVILPVPINQNYTYHVPPEFHERVQVGCRVIVQFGVRKFYTGLIKLIHNSKPEVETKPIETVLDDTPIISEQTFKFWEWIANYYCCSEGEVMKAALPKGLKLESQTNLSINLDWIETDRLSETEETVFQFLQNQKTATIQQINSITKKKNNYTVINSLIRKQAIITDEEIDKNYRPKTISYVKVASQLASEQDIENAFGQLKRASKQSELFMFLLNALDFFSAERKVSIPKKELITNSNSSETVLKGLVEKGFVEIEEVEVDRLIDSSAEKDMPTLNESQQEAINQINSQFEDKNVVLLHGVTASGKTEIYIKLIEEQLNLGKQVLYLLPEIALTSQIINRLKAVFGEKAGIFHSKFNDAEQVEIWNKVLEFEPNKPSKYQLILGTRSSLFLPFKDLGLIIVDEEHETSFKQFDPAPRYNARDAAVVLANLHAAKVLMGTATPSFETFYNCKLNKYGYFYLNKRHHDVELPEIVIADLADAYKRKSMKSHFTPLLFSEIQKALENNKQVILFQNRRGFSPFIQCKSCGWIPTCKHCDVSLTYHKFQNNLQCHYCGYTISLPDKCPDCQSTDIQTKGFGTEKIEDDLKIIFPEATIGRLDTDSSKTKFGHEKIIDKFAEGKTQILVGTQMVTKGLDFENVSVVGILNADNILNFPDFRSHERAYQLMVQVSGRAGRKTGKGKVIIQTFQPQHPVISMVINNDYENFFSKYIPERKLFIYPPCYRLIYITIKHKNNERTHIAANQLVAELRKKLKAKILGPEYPLIGRIQQYYQLMIRIKVEKNTTVSSTKKNIQESIARVKQIENNTSVIFNIDVDPM
jgi:primosomal protein N' (replication factor Y)